MAKINLKYIAHFSLWAGKLEETIEVSEKTTVNGVIERLEEKYGGFKEGVVDEKTGRLNSRNRVALRRAGGWTRDVVTSEDFGTDL